MSQQESIIVDFKENPQPYKIQSLCVQCGQSGETVLLLTKIPFFKEIMVGSFKCDECGNKNNQVQFVGQLPPHGLNIQFKATKKQDLGRQVIKSEYATITFKELGLQMPESKKAQITTIEGLLMRVEQQLSQGQSVRRQTDKQNHDKIEQFILKLQKYRNGQQLPFNMKIVDPSGNSNIKNPYAPKLDDNLMFSYPQRTLQQLNKMGYSQQNAQQGNKNKEQPQPMKKKNNEQVYEAPKSMDFTQPMNQKNFLAYQPTVFDIDCHVCMMPGQMKTCSTNIPYFTDLVIMSFSCQYCGAHNTDTKTSGEVGEHASTITLKVEEERDLKRDLFKSETCKVVIPELELQLDYGTLGGVFTTVEGLIQKIKTHFGELNSFTDSDGHFWAKVNEILLSLQQMMKFEKKFTLILRDPLDRSFLQNPSHPEQDTNVTRIKDQRTQEQMQYLGFDTMNV